MATGAGTGGALMKTGFAGVAVYAWVKAAGLEGEAYESWTGALYVGAAGAL